MAEHYGLRGPGGALVVYQSTALIGLLRIDDLVQFFIRDAIGEVQEPFPLQKGWSVDTGEQKLSRTPSQPTHLSFNVPWTISQPWKGKAFDACSKMEKLGEHDARYPRTH